MVPPHILCACIASQARLKNHLLRNIPDGLTFNDIEMRALVIMGNAYEDHLYVSSYDEPSIDPMVKQLYKNLDRSKLPDPFFAPKHVRHGGKQDLNELMKWSFGCWLKGEVYMGWITTGAKWGKVIFPPISAYKKNVYAIRRECTYSYYSITLRKHTIVELRICACAHTHNACLYY